MLLKGNAGVSLTISSIHPDTLNYYNRLIANKGIITDPDLRAVDTFVRGIHSAGLRSGITTGAIRQFCPYAGSNLNAALTNIWFPSAIAGSKPVNSQAGLLESDYSRSKGITGGAGKYIETGFNPALISSTFNGGLGLYCRTDSPHENADLIAQTSSSSSFSMYLRWSDNKLYSECYDTTSSLNTTPGSVLGWVCTTRASSLYTLYIRGASVTSVASLGNVPNAEIIVGQTNKSIGCFSIHVSLTDVQVSAYTTLVNNLMISFGRNV